MLILLFSVGKMIIFNYEFHIKNYLRIFAAKPRRKLIELKKTLISSSLLMYKGSVVNRFDNEQIFKF